MREDLWLAVADLSIQKRGITSAACGRIFGCVLYSLVTDYFPSLVSNITNHFVSYPI